MSIQFTAKIIKAISVTATIPTLITTAGGVCAPVTIKDQNNNTLASVASGGTYSVLAFSGIIDNGPPYSNSIVNP